MFGLLCLGHLHSGFSNHRELHGAIFCLVPRRILDLSPCDSRAILDIKGLIFHQHAGRLSNFCAFPLSFSLKPNTEFKPNIFLCKLKFV